MDIANRFLKAKFGDMTCKYHCYKGEDQCESDLWEILDEFKMIIESGELSELQNPRTKQFTLIDKSKGAIIGSYDNSFLNNS